MRIITRDNLVEYTDYNLACENCESESTSAIDADDAIRQAIDEDFVYTDDYKLLCAECYLAEK